MLLAANALPARVLEVQNPYSVTDLPFALNLSADLDDLASRFMGGDHRKTRWKLAV